MSSCLVGELPDVVFRLALEQDSDLVAFSLFDLIVEAIIGYVRLPAEKPFDIGLGEIFLIHLVPFLEPKKLVGNTTPELLRVFDRFFPHLLVLFPAFDVCLVDECFTGGNFRVSSIMLVMVDFSSVMWNLLYLYNG